jgi:hypothetical protein
MRWTSTWWQRWRGRSARRIAAQAAAVQEAERRAAVQRMLDAAHNAGPAWKAPKKPLATRNRPLLTLGQETRSRHGRR